MNSAIFKSPRSLGASPSPQNRKVTSTSPSHFKITSRSPHDTSSLLSTRDRVVIYMIADYSTFTNL